MTQLMGAERAWSRGLVAFSVLCLAHPDARGDVGLPGTEVSPLVFAVIVGNNDGLGVLPQLHFADDDALRFYRLAVRLAPERNVALLTELDVETWRRIQLSGSRPPPFLPPTKRRLVQVIDLYKQQIARARHDQPNRPVHLFFFFSGHGERGYFFLKRDGSQLADSAFTGQDLERAFAGSQATLNGLFIDACKSQSLFIAKGEEDDELGPDFSALINKVERARSVPLGVLTATVSDKPSGEAHDIQGGYFSHVLASGLSGAADANSDGVVRYGELAAFVAFHTRRIAGQRPWFRPPHGKLGVPLVVLKGRGDLLSILPGAGGHFAVFDAQGRNLLLELHKTEQQWTRLILPPDQYKVLWMKSSTQGLVAHVDLRRGSRTLIGGQFSQSMRLGRDVVPKGEGLGAPASAPAADDQALQAFDPASSGFDQPFTPRVVSALVAAYRAGLSPGADSPPPPPPPDLLAERHHLLSVGYGYFSPPVEPLAAGQGVSVAYAYRLPWLPLHLGVRGLFGFSDHAPPDRPAFGMRRFALQAEALLAYPFWRRFEVAAGGYIGWQLLLLTSQLDRADDVQSSQRITQLHGDARGFRAGLIGGLRVAFWKGIWVSVNIAWGVESANTLSARAADNLTHPRLFLRPEAFGQVGYAF